MSSALSSAVHWFSGRTAGWLALAFFIVAPFIGIYPVFAMKALCFALFACAFNLLLGYTGLLSFGHAAFMGAASTPAIAASAAPPA